MAFVLSEEQQMLRDSARSFANEKLPISQLRKLREKGEGFDGTTWREMAELGFTGVLIPEEFGGSNFGYLGLGQVLEAQGRTIAASPLLSTALIGASALVIAGSQAQKETYLPQIASGDLITALAVDEGAHHDPSHIKLAAKKSAGGYTLSGDKRYVVDGVEAGLLIVAARTSGGESDTSGITLFLVQGDARGVSRTALKTHEVVGQHQRCRRASQQLMHRLRKSRHQLLQVARHGFWHFRQIMGHFCHRSTSNRPAPAPARSGRLKV